MSAEKIYKRFALFVIQSVNTSISILKVIVQSRFGIKLPRAESTKCIVLANGPSLKQSLDKNLDLFKQYPLICVNTFAVTDEFTQLKPAYYVMIDPGFWEGENESIINTFKCLEEKTNWTLYLMVPKRALKQTVFIELAKKNSNIKITPFNYTVFKGYSFVANWFYKKNLAMPQSMNVTIAALFLGVNMGYKEIILVGADHTWHENLHLNDENILHTKVTHFYENDTQVKYVPFYWGNETKKLHEFFDMWSRTFLGYILLNEYANKCGSIIYNASEVSFIDAFERVKLK